MAHRKTERNPLFAGRWFEDDIILLCLRWYFRFKLSYRDLVAILGERGLSISHTTILRWVIRYAETCEKRWGRFQRPVGGSWRVDATFIKVRGQWMYLYRAVDGPGKTVEFFLSRTRGIAAAKAFFRKALKHHREPHSTTLDGHRPSHSALRRMGMNGEFSFRGPNPVRIRCCQYLNNVVEQAASPGRTPGLIAPTILSAPEPLGAVVSAVVVALLFPRFAMAFDIGGEIFLRVLFMMVVPLVMASVMSGIIGLGDIRKLGRPGGAAILYYVVTTVLAVVVGLVLVSLIQPGVGTIDQQTLDAIPAEGAVSAEQGEADLGTILENLVLMLFTDNLISAAGEAQLLPLIVFSIIFAGMLTTMGARVKAITEMIVQVNDALLSFILLLMKVAPLGIFCLVAARFGEAQAEGDFLQVLSQTGWYVSTVVLGLAPHAFITLPVILWIFTRRNPFQFMYQMSQALLTAFSTASSTATLPVTMECTVKKAGVSKQSADFVVPLGATINMDGTALYEATAAIFIAQAVGLQLGLLELLTVAVTATLAAIGAAGIPEAGLVTMVIVLNAVGLPVEYIGLILSVDWLLDRFRTTVNVFGDSAGSAVVEQTFPKPS